MTKVTILGQEPKEVKELKPIEFKLVHDDELDKFRAYNIKPCEWKNITLLYRNYVNGMDLMWCYENDNNFYKALVLGHFNDGVVSND